MNWNGDKKICRVCLHELHYCPVCGIATGHKNNQPEKYCDKDRKHPHEKEEEVIHAGH